MKALVTGATGFVGGHLVDALLERGEDVTALVRSTGRAIAMAQRGVRLVAGDLANRAALTDALRDVDVVYHVAAVLGAPTEAEFLSANRDGTAALVHAAEHTAPNARMVLVSSMAAGGPSRRGVPRMPDDPDHPVTMYGRSKLASEHVVATSALPWTVVRPPMVYGPRDRDNLLAVFRAARAGIAAVFGDGTMELSAIHVRDLVAAIIVAGDRSAALGARWYVNHPEVITSRGLVTAVGREVGRRPIIVPLPGWVARSALTVTGTWASMLKRKSILHPDKVNEFYQESWVADPSPFERATGWHAHFDLAHGLADTARWYREAGWL